MRLSRVVLPWALALSGMALFAAPAFAPFHLMKVREVYSDNGAGNGDFVELQMFENHENFVQGHLLNVYEDDGDQLTSWAFPGDAAIGTSQHTILVRKQGGPAGADFYAPALDLPAAGGAVCFEAIDCVSWGNFAGTPPSPAGDPAFAMDGTSSLTRTVVPECSTLLQSGDDRNSGDLDFSLQVPSPRSNSATPTEAPCLLTVTLSGSGTGTVSAPGFACPTICSFPYLGGQMVTATATPASGSLFGGWTACPGPSIGNICSVDMYESRAIGASFTADPNAPRPPPSGASPATTAQAAPAQTGKRSKKCGKRKKRCRRKRG